MESRVEGRVGERDAGRAGATGRRSFGGSRKENFVRMLRDDEASSEPQVWEFVTGDEVVRVGAGDSEEPCGFLDRRGDQGWAHAPGERSPALTSTPRGTA